MLRNFLKTFKPSFKFVPVQQLQYAPAGFNVDRKPIYSFAIAFVAVPFQGANNANPWTRAMDLSAAGSNVGLVVTVGGEDATHSSDCSSVVWDGQSMTQAGTTATGGVNGVVQMWVLGGANTVSGNLVLTHVSGSNYIYLSALTYSGCSSTQPDAYTSPVSKTGNFSVSVTTVADNAWIVLCSNYGGTAGANTNQRNAATNWNGDRGPLSPAGSYAVAENTAAGSNQAIAGAVSLTPYVAPSGPANWKTYNTVTVSSNLKTLNTNTLANIKTYDTIS